MTEKQDNGFARKLRSLRAEHRMTQEELAKAVKASTASVRNWEDGEYMPTMAMSVRLADLFGISLDQLAGRA